MMLKTYVDLHLKSSIFLVGVCLSFASNAACLPEKTTGAPVDSSQAKQLLDSAIFAASDPQAKLDEKYLADLNCSLEILTTFDSRLRPSNLQLIQLGRNIIAAQTQEQQMAAANVINQSVNRDAGTAYVVLPSNDGQLETSLYDQILGPNCSNVPSARCTQALHAAKTLWQVAGEYRAFANTYNNASMTQSLAYQERLNKQWVSYRDDTILLWPQEVLLNSLVFDPNSSGFTEPPNYKLLSIRPSFGLTYLSDQSHHIQPTLNIDLLGIYWWKYADDAKAGPGRGLSASLIWDGDDVAYGLSYHHNPNWSLSVASGDADDIQVSISFQLAGWLLHR